MSHPTTSTMIQRASGAGGGRSFSRRSSLRHRPRLPPLAAARARARSPMRSRVVHPPEPNPSVRPIHQAVGPRALWALAYVVLAALFVMQVARLRDGRTGFTPLVIFGDYFAPVRLTRLRNVRVYTYRISVGYDGQF